MSEEALYWRMEAERHAPTLECAPVHCEIHQADEPEEQAHNICLECNHVYMTPADLIDTYNAIGIQSEQEAIENGWAPLEFQLVDDTEQIHFCPLCTHDW